MKVAGDPIRVQSLLKIAKYSQVPHQYIQPPETRPDTFSPPNTAAAIPTIDISNSCDAALLHRDICGACRDWGAFHVTNHGVPVKLLHDMRSNGMSFFEDLDLPDKLKYSCDPNSPASEGYGSRMLVESKGTEGEREDSGSKCLSSCPAAQKRKMGAGGRMSAPPTGKKTEAEALRRAPHEKPPFTIGDLKKAIPPHCFQKSLITSFRYLIQDLIMAYTLYYVATNYIDLLPRPLNYLGWAAYIAVQGCVLTGAWVVGHECDHHAFSDYQWVDDLVGLVVHSSLLVPYFSWKISHRRHHANTQSLENDEVYVPRFKSNIRNYYKILNNPPGRVFVWITTLLIGFPLYLMFNVSGHKYERWTSHYDPHSPLYSDRERKEIIISDVAILAVIYGLYRLVLAKGFAWVFCVYGGPLLVVNGWFVLITILNHTHPSLPYYDSTEWDWLRGALCTVDRDYGILNKVFHNVCNAHVCHHIFSMIPHYHGLEATEAMKPILGEYYQYDGTPILKAMYREMKECIYVEKDEGETKGVYWYRSKF